jgi:hypothetical protein
LLSVEVGASGRQRLIGSGALDQHRHCLVHQRKRRREHAQLGEAHHVRLIDGPRQCTFHYAMLAHRIA